MAPAPAPGHALASSRLPAPQTALHASNQPPPQAQLLDVNTQYDWRVDTELGSGEVVPGAVWTFTTDDRLACGIAPAPPPAPPPPAPPPPPEDCAAAEAANCPGQEGKGKACYDCVLEFSKQLEAAGCWKASGQGKGARHAFVQKWCSYP